MKNNKSKFVAVRLPLSLAERVEAMAYRQKKTVSDIIREAIAEYIEK